MVIHLGTYSPVSPGYRYQLQALHRGLSQGVFAERTEHAEQVNPARCVECGSCAQNCPVQAIKVRSGVGCARTMISAALRGRDMDSGSAAAGEIPDPIEVNKKHHAIMNI